MLEIDTDCKDISEVREYLRITENLLHKQHYLNLIAKRYLIQLLDNQKIDLPKDINENSSQYEDEIKSKVNEKVIDQLVIKRFQF